MPIVTVVTTFVAAQTQFARVLGEGTWAALLWPALEWLIGAAMVAAWYHADWPRWRWSAVWQSTAEAALVVGLSSAWWLAFAPGATAPELVTTALPGLLIALGPLALWCAAEETVLRGVLGRLTQALHPVTRALVLAVVAVGVALVTGQAYGWYTVLALAAIESVSLVGFIAGHPLAVVAARRWWLRVAIVACGVPAVGFTTGLAPVVRLPWSDPTLAVLSIVSACVVWSCVVLVERVVVDLRLQQAPPENV